MQETPDQTLQNARRSLQTQREGGTHRPASSASIGKGSANAKLKNLLKRAGYFGAAVLAIFVAISVAGAILGGIGFWGVVTAFFAVLGAAILFSQFPKVKAPKLADLGKGNPRQMVARTELWLEAQRPALPAPAVAIVENLGVQLDALGAQLETIDADHPAAREVRELVGEYIPETIQDYLKVPAHMRGEEHAGKTADERLTNSLTRISAEVDRVTRRLAEGALDDLAIKDRYLDYRYGGDEMIADMRGDTDAAPDTGVPLPDLSTTRQKTP
ncbi:hypothetical protein [Qipengyuania nanhaisediminis]|uniref:hypothetical protein n=1 Tax=Qipengyuania nanhaisediminis TaxID=604088 RepID=UPI0038B340C7